MPWYVVFIIGGIILRANPEWFDGASTAGTVLLAFGLFIVFIWLLLLLFVGMFDGSGTTTYRRRRR